MLKSRKPSLHPLLVLMAVALVSVLVAVACGGAATSTAVPSAPEAATEDTAAEDTAAEDTAAEDTAAEDTAAEDTAAEDTAAEDTAAEDAAEEAAEPAQDKFGGSLAVAYIADHGSLDPGFALAAMDISTIENTYDPLVRLDENGEYVPALATHWDISDDTTQYTFYLREGVKFHTGRDFSAADVLFSVERHMDPELDTVGASQVAEVAELVALDDMTVQFTLEAANGFFMDSLTLYQFHILPADVDTTKLATEEFGTGAFEIAEYLPGERITMSKFEGYWNAPLPYLDELVFVGIAETAVRAEALKSGDVQGVFRLEPQSIQTIYDHPDTKVESVATSGPFGFYIDTTQPPYDNLLLRQALQAATDRDLINQAVTLGLGVIGNDTPVWPSDPRWTTECAPPDYDPELAKSLLSQAGYPDGIDLVLNTGEVGPGMVELAVAAKESFAPAGIRVEVMKRPTDSYWSEVFMVEPFSIVYWSGRSNPNHVLSLGYMKDSVWNANRWGTERLDELITISRGQSGDAQKESYREIQCILIENVPGIMVGFQPLHFGARNNVHAKPHPLGYRFYVEAWIEK